MLPAKKIVRLFPEIGGYLEHVKIALADRISPDPLSRLDFTGSEVSPIGEDTAYLRIPLKGKGLNEEFLLLHTNRAGKIQEGRWISLAPKELDAPRPWQYNGGIIIRSLQGALLHASPIVNGFIIAFHPETNALTRVAVVPDPYETMPEVVVVSYRSSDWGYSSDFMSFQSLLGYDYGGGSGYYSSIDGAYPSGGGGGGSYSGGSYGGGVTYSAPIVVDFEKQQSKAGIDLKSFLSCFDKIADAGANCTIEILSDIPVDGDPNKLFNFDSESPGHVFLQLRKSNSIQSVVQNIGFYPETHWKAMLTPGPVKGKFVDNGQHEYNASLKMSVSPAQLKSAITHMLYLSNFVRYDIDEYNCTDFALEVFNYVRHPSAKIEIPKYAIPGGMASAGTSTPQGLYNKLKSLQQSGGAGASNTISIPGYKGWVTTSKGACN